MSQRTRNRTIGAAARKRPPAARQTAASSDPPASADERSGDASSVTPETLARTLRAVAAELERDPALARRLAEAIATNSNSNSTTPAPPSGGRPEAPAAVAVEQPQPVRSRPARVFTPSIVTGVSPDLGPGIPDPFALARRLGPDGLRAALAGLRLGTLRAMIREHGIAPAAQIARMGDDTKLREMILTAVLK